MRDRPLRPLPVRPRSSSARTGRCSATIAIARSAAGCGRSDMAARARKPTTRRLEVRVLRRLPAQPARLRGRAAGAWPVRSRSPTSSRRRAVRSRGPYDLSLVEGLDHHGARCRAHPARCAAQSKASGDDRRLRHGRRHPGAAQLRGRRRSSSSVVYARPDYIRRWPPRRRSPTTSRSISSCAAARSTSTSSLEVIVCLPAGAPTGDTAAQRLHRVQAARATSA